VELPQRLIELYTYEGDVVLDPFMGSGSSAVAAVRTGRHYIGFDTDADYVQAAERRIDEERAGASGSAAGARSLRVALPAVEAVDRPEDPNARALREGRQAKDLARVLLEECGFTNLRENVKPRKTGVAVTFVAQDETGEDWAFDVSGGFTSNRTGLRKADTLWRSLGTAGVLHASPSWTTPLVLLTTDAPSKGTAGAQALAAMRGPGGPVVDVIELLRPEDQRRLRDHAVNGRAAART
jgi:site-specific DNA-methyltransferase (adenine-specific)